MTSPAKVTVKHGKNEYKGVELVEGFELFQAALMSLTGVPVERQKLIIKGKSVKDDTTYKAHLKNGDTVMLMGSAEALPAAPAKKIVFEEDLTDSQKASMATLALAGLTNLGNTCYMNSTLQCLRAIVPLKQSLHKYSQSANGNDITHTLTASLGRLFQEMDASNKAITPYVFCQAFRTAFPQFAEKSSKTGGYMQQDADECLQQIVHALGTKLSASPEGKQNMLDYLFAGEIETRIKCTEPGGESEPERVETETIRKLRCHIDDKTNFLSEGIAKDMDEKLERQSSVLGRNAQFQKTSRIKKLPRYLIVQFVRFFWRNDTQLKAKILRKVQYPMELDLLQFCAPALKAALTANRAILSDEKDAALGLSKKKPASAATATDAKKTDAKAPAAAPAAAAVPAGAAAATNTTAAPMEGVESTSSPKEFDISGGMTSGMYEMFGVVTHKGRSADSGHYVGWVREKGDNWVCYDDDQVSTCKTDDILKLSGGGDWHMTYMCMYRRIDDLADRFDANGKPKPKPAGAAAAPAAGAGAAAAGK